MDIALTYNELLFECVNIRVYDRNVAGCHKLNKTTYNKKKYCLFLFKRNNWVYLHFNF